MSLQHLPTFDLTGKVALVTGGTKGMGRAIAALLAQAGARVAVSSRNQADCDRVAAEINPETGQCIGVASDIGDSTTLAPLVETVKARLGAPDILVCNAAFVHPLSPLSKVEASLFDEIMATNVRNNFLLINLVAPEMAARGQGSIIVISSIAGGRGRAGMGPYGISKAAVNQLVRSLAVELGPQQIRVNAIAPATVRTDFSRELWDNPEIMAKALARSPMGRIGEADDVAGLALLLASPAGAFINGQTIGVDGGVSIS